MQTQLRPARVPVPGATIRSEIEARGWNQRDFSKIIGRPYTYISELIRGKRAITVETAIQLEAALDVPARFWLQLEANYRLWLQEQSGSPEVASIAERRKTYSATGGK
jgi:HTH-type transcriptional regulator/antitoxin HigA